MSSRNSELAVATVIMIACFLLLSAMDDRMGHRELSNRKKQLLLLDLAAKHNAFRMAEDQARLKTRIGWGRDPSPNAESSDRFAFSGGLNETDTAFSSTASYSPGVTKHEMRSASTPSIYDEGENKGEHFFKPDAATD